MASRARACQREVGPNGEMWSCLAALGLSPAPVVVYPPLCKTEEQELGLKDKDDVEDERMSLIAKNMSLSSVQGDPIGCRTGNGGKLNNS